MPTCPLTTIDIGMFYTLWVPSDAPSTVFVVASGPVTYPTIPPETVLARHLNDIQVQHDAHNIEY